NTPKDGESLSEFLNRVQLGLDEIRSKYSGKKILLVSHQGTMQAVRLLVENCSYQETKNMMLKNTESFKLSLNPLIKRIPEVLDCWFESGSMPYAQQHFPFEIGDDKRGVPRNFPANFIAEGLDQTRAWFYTLMVLSTALFGKTPFENVVVNGIVLAEDGKKMSKRLRNYPDPLEVVNKHGADAVRFSLMSSPAVRAEDLRFSEKLIGETVRNVLLPLWNIYSFFVTYANAANFEAVDTRTHSSHPLDMWMKAETQDLVNRMTEELDRYDLSATCSELHETIDVLTNWYIRLSRRRFAGKGVTEGSIPSTGDSEAEDCMNALHTLHDVLLTISQLLAPFCPYITDAIYLNLISEEHGSVHLTDWPEVRKLNNEEINLLEKNRTMRKLVSLGNTIRSEQNIKIRQPLSLATIALPPSVSKEITFEQEDLQLLKQELNVKSIEFAENPEDLAESFVQVDARKVGPRLGKRVQEIIIAGKQGEFKIEDDGSILILDERLSSDEATLAYRSKDDAGDGGVAADKGIVLKLETNISNDLNLEGEARDLIRAVQRLRKESNFHFKDEIILSVSGMDEVLEKFADLITQETRATYGENDGEEHTADIGENEVIIKFRKK
ncbi:MAG: class I tRNA ligase family protein, partial [Candidatus Peribacteraceae bacterium]|nr:class I tRNA ligase family protein [Candidatus Peribacteraceae bacterium]